MNLQSLPTAGQRPEWLDSGLVAVRSGIDPNQEPIYADRMKLARCPYFQTALKWSTINEIVVPAIKRETLSLLIEFLYSQNLSDTRITSLNALDLWFGAHILVLDEVKAICAPLIMKMPITIENCSQMLTCAIFMKCADLIDSCMRFILIFLHEILNRPEFLCLDTRIMQALIKRGLKDGNSPAELLQMVINWLNYGGQDRIKSSVNLLSLIPLRDIAPKDITNILSNGLQKELKGLLACL